MSSVASTNPAVAEVRERYRRQKLLINYLVKTLIPDKDGSISQCSFCTESNYVIFNFTYATVLC